MRITRWFKQSLFIVLGVSAAALTACTKTSDSKTASLKLTLPDPNTAFAGKLQAPIVSSKVSSSATTMATPSPTPAQLTSRTYYSRVMINIQGGGLAAPIVYIQEMKNPTDTLNLNPAFDVPRNTTPTVQVLLLTQTVWIDTVTGVVVQGDGGSNQGFYYGDAASVSLTSDSQSLPITVQSVNVTAGAQGAISGRLINSDGSGLTGKVAIRFVPPTRPDGTVPLAMTVSQTEIHGGWFDFFAFEGLRFSYVYDDGNGNTQQLLAGKTIDATPSGLGAGQMFVTVPPGFTSMWEGNMEVARQPWPGSKFWFGWFGPGAPAANQVCYDSATGAGIQGVYSSSTVGSQTQITWGAGSPDSSHAGVVTGGAAATNGNCGTTTNYWSGWIKIPDMQRLRDGHGILGFRGPFRAIAGTYGPTVLDAVSDNVSSVTLKWGYLPGTTGSGRVDGVDVFLRTLANPPPQNGGGQKDYQIDDNIACNRLTDPKFLTTVFQKVTRVPVTGASVESTTLAGITPSDFSVGKVQIVLCPYSNSRSDYFTAGIDYSSRGGSSNSGSVTSLAIYGPLMQPSPAPSPVAATNVCTPLTLVPLDAGGRPTWLPSSPTVTMGAAGGNATFYSDPTCNNLIPSGGGPVQNFGMNGSSIIRVYMKSTATAATLTVSANVQTAASGSSPAVNVSSSIGVGVAPAGSPSQLQVVGLPASMMAYTCYPAMALLLDSSNRVVPGSSPAPYVNTSPVANVNFYDLQQDSSCSNPTPSFSMSFSASPTPAPSGFKPIGVRYTGTAAITTATDILSGMNTYISPNTINSQPVSITVGLPGAPTQLWLMTNNNFSSEMCNGITVALKDANGYDTPATAVTSVSVSTTGSPIFYNDSTCNSVSAGSGSYTLTLDVTSQATIWYRETGRGSLTMSATVTSPTGSGIASTSQNLTVGPAQVAKVVLTTASQTYLSPMSVSGSPDPISHGTPIPVVVTALSPLDNPVNGQTVNINIQQSGGNILLNGNSGGTSVTFAAASNTATINMDCTSANTYPAYLYPTLMSPPMSPYGIIYQLSSLSCN